MVSTVVNKLLKEEKYLILLIVFTASLFRFYKLYQFPVSLSMDEVSIGYSAYSILTTGKDEWGEFMPLAFRSVGDYKPPVNIYLTALSISLFGLTEFAVRFPVALLGSITPLIFYFILRNFKLNRIAAFVAGIWFAISPWHVHFSRGSFEAVTGLFFTLLGLLFFLRSFKKASYLSFSFALIFFCLAVWSYHAERLFIPLFFIGLSFIYRRGFTFLFNDRKKLMISVIPFLLLAVPFARLTLFTPAIRERAASTSILREQNLIRQLHFGDYKSMGEEIFDNDFYLIFRHWSGKYLNYFDLRFWFWKGMQFTPPGYFDMGLFYVLNIFIILPGIYLLIGRKMTRFKQLALLWFFLGPIPASFTMNEQHPLRALIWLPFFGFAIAYFINYYGKVLLKESKVIYVFSFLYIINVVWFSDIYFRQFPRFFADAWQYGYKQISIYACEHKDQYNWVIITNTFGSEVPINTGLPGLYYLFYCKIPPEDFQNEKKLMEGVEFKRVQWKTDKILKDSLIIGSYWDLHPDYVPEDNIIKRIYYPSGRQAFIFVDTRGYENDFYWSEDQ